jgi:transposase
MMGKKDSQMLLVGYLYGIKSERRLTEDVALNPAYGSLS